MPRILVLAPNPWVGQWVNRQQLFSRLGKSIDVLYATGGWFSWDRHGADWKIADWAGDFGAHDNVWVDQSPKYLMRLPRLKWWDEMVLALQVRRWKRFLRNFGPGPLVLYVFHPMFLPYVRLMDADLVVYHAYDLYDHTPGWTDLLESAEHALLQRANLVVASSEQIAAALTQKGKREVRVLPNGADFEAFERARLGPADEPADLSAVPRPRLGWAGSLHPHVDYGLVAQIARRRPDWHFVLVGEVVAVADAKAEAELVECRALPNVHFLGGKPASEVPKYLTHMDINLMFYRLTQGNWIQAGYPLKLHEYLATGHPVVSADVPSVRPFSHVVQIAHGCDEWCTAIEEALTLGARGSRNERLAVARENSWNERVRVLGTWLIEATSPKQ